MSATSLIINDPYRFGADTAILPGATIEESSVIGAGSVVAKDLPENSITAETPCRTLRTINEDDMRND